LIDVCFLLDASGSINADGTLTNWNLMKGFVETLISSLPVSVTNTHIALIRFSIVADVIFPFDQFYDAKSAVKVLILLLIKFIFVATKPSNISPLVPC
jgi:von Willebrand factor type A domain